MLIRADARQIPLQDACVQCVVTSPPYWGLRDYGIDGQLGLESTPDAYVAALVSVFREVRRVLKDDGTVWLNLGDSYATGAGSGRSMGGACFGKQNQVIDAASYPANQPNRMPIDGLKPKDLVGIPWRVAFALQADGWYLRSDIIWHKPNPMPESVTDRPTKAHEYLFLLAKAASYYYNADALREPNSDDLSGGRQYAQAKYLRLEKRNPNGQPDGQGHNMYGRDNLKGRNKRSVWTIPTQPYTGAHFATMPEALVTPCILAGSRGGDLVLDPFSGSGTVLEVANRLGRRSVGCDINPVYHDLTKTRTAQRGLRF
jgi:DNA modification methylase